MAERTASEVSVQLNKLKLSSAVLCQLWIRLGSIYEKTKKIDLALQSYMKSIEIDPDQSKPLYRFVAVSKEFKPNMIENCLKLLGIHFLSLLTEYETTRKVVIDNMIISQKIEKEKKEKELKLKEYKKITESGEGNEISKEEMLNAISSLESQGSRSAPGGTGFSGVIRKDRRVMGRKRGRSKSTIATIKKAIADNESLMSSKRRKIEEKKDVENKGKNENENDGENIENIDKVEVVQEGGEGAVNDDGDDINNNEEEEEGRDEGDNNENNEGNEEGNEEEEDDSYFFDIDEGDIEEEGEEGEEKEEGEGYEMDVEKLHGIDDVVKDAADSLLIENNRDNEDDNEGNIDRTENETNNEENDEEGDIPLTAFSPPVGSRRFSRAALEDELRAIVLWATMLGETGAVLMGCCFCVSMVLAWCYGHGDDYYVVIALWAMMLGEKGK